MRFVTLICCAVIAVLALGVAPFAGAAGHPINAGSDPAGAQLGDELASINSRTAAGGSDSQAQSDPGVLQARVVTQLPFTGLDLVSLAAVALALIGAGFVVRRVGRRGTRPAAGQRTGTRRAADVNGQTSVATLPARPAADADPAFAEAAYGSNR